MAMGSLIDRYHDKIAGVLSCWDRVVIRGTLPGLCYAGGMTSYLYAQHIRIFDYPRFAEPLRDAVRARVGSISARAASLRGGLNDSGPRSGLRQEISRRCAGSRERPNPSVMLRLIRSTARSAQPRRSDAPRSASKSGLALPRWAVVVQWAQSNTASRELAT